MTRLGVPTRLVFVPGALAWPAAAMLEHAWPRGTGMSGPPLTRYAVGQLAAEHTLDITRVRTLLGYEPRWSYRDGPLT
jgi:nucleoside-diphosphate-sugar epimerase